MKLREQRGGLAESMQTVIEIEPTLNALFQVINDEFSCFGVFITPDMIHVKPYGFDSRINWDTYIVTVDDYGVYGFTDGPLEVSNVA